jgi:hypothetical protein
MFRHSRGGHQQPVQQRVQYVAPIARPPVHVRAIESCHGRRPAAETGLTSRDEFRRRVAESAGKAWGARNLSHPPGLCESRSPLSDVGADIIFRASHWARLVAGSRGRQEFPLNFPIIRWISASASKGLAFRESWLGRIAHSQGRRPSVSALRHPDHYGWQAGSGRSSGVRHVATLPLGT